MNRKSWDVFMESFVNVSLPADVDPTTPEGRDKLLEEARRVYIQRIVTKQAEFSWRRFKEGDE